MLLELPIFIFVHDDSADLKQQKGEVDNKEMLHSLEYEMQNEPQNFGTTNASVVTTTMHGINLSEGMSELRCMPS